MNKKDISAVMRAMGKKGGKIGGKRSLETMTAEERSARAKKALLVAARNRMAKRLAAEAATKAAKRITRRNGAPVGGSEQQAS